MNKPTQNIELDRKHPIYKALADTVLRIRKTAHEIQPGEEGLTEGQTNQIKRTTDATCGTLAVGLCLDFQCMELLPSIMGDFGFSDGYTNKATGTIGDIISDMQNAAD